MGIYTNNTERLNIVDGSLLTVMASTNRFKNASLSCYVDEFDEKKQVQFSAMVISLEDDTSYVAFRGTDMSICGWREDFAMSYQLVPAQESALRYLETVAELIPGNLRIGGHSKGGNLAMFASMMCSQSIRDRIFVIYNNDGPGFCPNMAWAKKYQEIAKRTIKIVPEFSVIGMVFAEGQPHRTIASNVKGLIQHDLMTWKVNGNRFVEKSGFTYHCKRMNGILNRWIKNVDTEQRISFTTDFFDALEVNGAVVIKDVLSGGFGGFMKILMSIVKSRKSTKRAIKEFFIAFVVELKEIGRDRTIPPIGI
jgi:hypothetical protein